MNLAFSHLAKWQTYVYVFLKIISAFYLRHLRPVLLGVSKLQFTNYPLRTKL